MSSQAVEDLIWVINSPSLVTGENVASPHKLDRGDIDLERLEAFLGPQPVHRVGRYFESLLHYWLVHLRQVELIEAGLQIRDGKRTIGEIDFLYRNESGVLVHCEASVKFFLHYPRQGVSDYPGPNASDDFERKATKLFDQQLPLSKQHAPDVEVREAFVKGMIFYRWQQQSPAQRPARMSDDHLRGQWLRESELDMLAARPDTEGTIAEKPHWLAPALGPAMPAPELADRLRRHFASERPHPVMLCLRGTSGESVQSERAFVVNDRWPT